MDNLVQRELHLLVTAKQASRLRSFAKGLTLLTIHKAQVFETACAWRMQQQDS